VQACVKKKKGGLSLKKKGTALRDGLKKTPPPGVVAISRVRGVASLCDSHHSVVFSEKRFRVRKKKGDHIYKRSVALKKKLY